MTIKPEGICNGEFLKPMRTTVQAVVDGKELPHKEVGFVAENVSIDSTSGVGANAYACSGTKLSNYSFISGEDFGHVEVYNSEIKGGSHITGNAIITNSVIDHAEIQGKFANSENQILDFNEFLKLNYVVTEDKLDSAVGPESVPPIFLGGNINIAGAPSKEVIIERDKPFTDPASLIGSFISIRGGQLRIEAPVELYDTDIIVNHNNSTVSFEPLNKIEIFGATILREGRIALETFGDKFNKISIKNVGAYGFSFTNYFRGIEPTDIKIEDSDLKGVTVTSSNVSKSELIDTFVGYSTVKNSKFTVVLDTENLKNTISQSTVLDTVAKSSVINESKIYSCTLDKYNAQLTEIKNMNCYRVEVQDFVYTWKCDPKGPPTDPPPTPQPTP